jgi:Tfp pilus assembly protein PilW
MVAMAVGLIISAGAAALFANTILSTRTLTNATQIQEAGTQMSQQLARQLRMAGYVDWLSSTALFGELSNADNAAAYNLQAGTSNTIFQRAFAAQTSQSASQIPLAVHGCSGPYAAPSATGNTACAGAVLGSNAITIAYQVSSSPDADSAPGLGMTGFFSNRLGMAGDCNNQSVSQLYAVNRFYINANNELVCQGSGGSAQPIASNIEQLVFEYGVNNPNVTSVNSNDTQVSRYQTAAQVTANNEWGQVISIRMCMVVMGETNSAAIAGSGATANRQDCLGNPLALLSDRRLRQTFVNTVALRNHIHTAK